MDVDHGHDHTGVGDPHGHDWVGGKRQGPRSLTPEVSAGADQHRLNVTPQAATNAAKVTIMGVILVWTLRVLVVAAAAP